MRTPSITSPLPFRFGFPLEEGDPEVVYFLRALFLLPSSSFRRHKIRQTVNTMKSGDLMIKGVAKHIETEEEKTPQQKGPKLWMLFSHTSRYILQLRWDWMCLPTGCTSSFSALSFILATSKSHKSDELGSFTDQQSIWSDFNHNLKGDDLI